ncbi:DUF3006 domain-containing protein [Alkalihalophilus marmarensis]|uniref:DUF3006 domain-containing protein n=1 Tax=Alkalihalophilus marmarensis DSM 21297 TaxID=1188261 RepID=U6SQ83_9BACI|nr:DUF3006 domain-containing protein [Alkalihalophilus marmarensis]ERN52811.1 hypothetical protein A33I_14035 [Alkalihalophilus marmarensis DSM 21297]MCM3489062.1 DUF3006 domain-containing protein [Alkalihalophilus marmarensis]
MEKKAVLDRIVDGEHAVLLVGDKEEEKIISVSQLPKEAREGAWLKITLTESNEVSVVVLDVDETNIARSRISSKMELLKKRKGSKFKK